QMHLVLRFDYGSIVPWGRGTNQIGPMGPLGPIGPMQPGDPPMSPPIPPVPIRHPLRLPAGSLRALLAMLIAGLFRLLLLLPAEKQMPIPLFLYFLAGMVLMFFVAHGNSISANGQPPPWGLPRGTFRFLLIVGTIGVIAAYIYLRNSSPLPRLVPNAEQLK